MTTNDCEHVRIRLMALVDGEADADLASGREHLASCASCQTWLTHMESLTTRLQQLSYPAAHQDLWLGVRDLISQPDRKSSLTRQVWPIGAAALAWRTLQLAVDLPLPELHPLVPLALAVVVIWRVGGHLLAIETVAPELGKEASHGIA